MKCDRRGGTWDRYLERECGEAGRKGQDSREETGGCKRHRKLSLCHAPLQDSSLSVCCWWTRDQGL